MNNLVKNFPFVYLCESREYYDNFVCLYYDKKEELNLMSSDKEIFESIFGFVPKEFLNSEYTTSFIINLLESSERFERVSEYPIYGDIDFDVELNEILKKLPNDILKYYTDIIHNRGIKKEKQDYKDRKIDYLEEELNKTKDELFKFKCQSIYERSGWQSFYEYIKTHFDL